MWCLLLAAAIAPGATAQDQDYHLEETPAVTWNGLAYQDARMLALGGVSLLASGPFAGAANPALIPADRGLELGLTADRLDFEAFQYWGVNQGVVSHLSPLSDRATALGGVAARFAARQLRLSAGWYLRALPRFPSFAFREDYEYEQYDQYSGSFSGTDGAFFLAAATPTWRGFSLGARLEYVSETRRVTISDASESYFRFGGRWERRYLDIRREETHEGSLLVPCLGLSWSVSPRWTLAVAAEWPLDGTVERTVLRSFESATDGIHISEQQTASDPLERPARISAGTRLGIDLGGSSAGRASLLVAAEATHQRWAGHRYVSFGEGRGRDLRDTVGFAGGVELAAARDKGGYSVRLGYRFDPQPVRAPEAALHVFTGGGGMHRGSLGLDAALSYHRGSPGGVEQGHVAIGMTLRMALGEAK